MENNVEEEDKETEKTTRTGTFIPVGEVVAKLTGSFLERPRGKAGFLGSAWTQAVGERVAKHSEPDRLANGLLTVRVDSSTWTSELTHMKPKVLALIQKASPGSNIRDLRFVQGSLRSKIDPPGEKKRTEKLPPPLPEEVEKASHMVAAVTDPELRAVLFKLSQTLLIRRRCG